MTRVPKVARNGNGQRPIWAAVLVSCIPLAPALTTVVVFQVASNERQEAEILANKTEIDSVRRDVFSLNTPLSGKVLKIEDTVGEISRDQTRIVIMAERMNEKISLFDKTLSEVGAAVDRFKEDLGMTTVKSPRRK